MKLVVAAAVALAALSCVEAQGGDLSDVAGRWFFAVLWNLLRFWNVF